MAASFVDVSTDAKTIAGEPLEYPSTPNPVIFSNVVTIPPGTVTPWMVHPVPAYLYILEGTLTVEFAADGSLHKFNAGQAFLQERGLTGIGAAMTAQLLSVSFGVFVGSKDVPVILHPPSSKSVQESFFLTHAISLDTSTVLLPPKSGSLPARAPDRGHPECNG